MSMKKINGADSEGYVDADEQTANADETSPFVWIPSITMSSIGVDRGAGRRLGKTCPVAQIWGAAKSVRASEPDPRYGGKIWLALNGLFEAATFDPETGEIKATYRSADLYLPTSFQASMIEVVNAAGGEPVEFRLDIAVRPAGHDGAYLARAKIIGEVADPMAELRGRLGVAGSKLLGAPK